MKTSFFAQLCKFMNKLDHTHMGSGGIIEKITLHLAKYVTTTSISDFDTNIILLACVHTVQSKQMQTCR